MGVRARVALALCQASYPAFPRVRFFSLTVIRTTCTEIHVGKPTPLVASTRTAHK